jgi:hypothetical protein
MSFATREGAEQPAPRPGPRRLVPTRELKIAFGSAVGGTLLAVGGAAVAVNTFLVPMIPTLVGSVLTAAMVGAGIALALHGYRIRETEIVRQGFGPTGSDAYRKENDPKRD